MSNNIPPGKSAPWEGEDEVSPDVESPVQKDVPVPSAGCQDESDESDIDPFAPPVGGIAE